MLYKWLKHNAYNGDQKRSFPFIRVMFDFKPKLMINKYKYEKLTKRLKVQKVGHIHIPKTGGSYLNTLSNNEFPHLSFNHVLVRNNRSDIYVPVGLTPIKRTKIEGYYLFSTVRNPLLYYHHTKNFEEYINSKHYDYENAQKGFRHLVLIGLINGHQKNSYSLNFLMIKVFLL